MIKKFMLVLGIACLPFVLAGCGDISKIKSVKKVALAGVTFKKDFEELDKNGNEKGAFGAIKLDASGLKFGEPDPAAEAYYTNIINQLVTMFARNGITIVTADQFKDNATFNKLTKEPGRADMISNTYSPDPYVSGKFNPDGPVAIQLCKELNVDAVAFFYIYAVRIQEDPSIFMPIPRSKLGLRGKLTLIGKDGTTIVGYQTFTAESDSEVDFGKLLLGNNSMFKIPVENRDMFEALSNRFIRRVEAYLQSGLK